MANSSVDHLSSPQIVGIILAIVSGVLIGSSFVFKKKGLLRSQAGHAAGEGVAYLKSVCYLPVLRCTLESYKRGLFNRYYGGVE